MQALLDLGSLAGRTDGELLDRFRADRPPAAEVAFSLLVERHGPMVLRVCRDLLGNPHDADDAFQAVFLALARQGAGIRRRDEVGCWLHAVARRVALRLRRRRARLRLLERPGLVGDAEPAATPPREAWPELHEELDRLPDRFRAAVILCDLQGHSYEQAARLLRCPLGTLQSRLARGRQRLRQRLERKGLGLSILPIAADAGPRPPSTPLPHGLAARTIEAALRDLAGAGGPALGQVAWAELRGPRVIGLGMAAAVGLLTTLLMGGIALAPRSNQAGLAAPAPLSVRREPVVVRVVNEQEKPVADIRVEMTGSELEGTKVLRSDVDGFVDVPAVAPEEIRTLVARHGDALGWVPFEGPDLNGVAGTRADPVLLRLRPLNHRVRGSVVDEHGTGLLDAEVVAVGLGDGREGPLTGRSMYVFSPDQLPSLPRARTDAHGRYEIALPAGPANLVARHSFFQAMGGHVDAASPTLEPIVLEPGGWINGRVVDAITNKPMPGVRLGAQLIESRRVVKGGWGEATVGDDGRFAIKGLEPGVYNLLFLHAPGRPSATARAVQGVRVGLKQGAATLVKVIEGRPLRGVVVSHPGDRPVPGVSVGCYGPARPQSGAAVMTAKTDASGAFTFHVPPGEQHVYLMDANARSRLNRRTLDVAERGPIEEVRLVNLENPPPAQAGMMKAAIPVPVPEPPNRKDAAAKAVDAPEIRLRTIRGRVHDRGGEPIVAATVSLDPASAGLLPPVAGAPPGSADTAATDREGFFELAGVPAAALTIWITRPGLEGQQASVPADRDEIQITYGAPKPSVRDPMPVRRDDRIPLALRDRLIFIDLSKAGNEMLADGPGGAGNDLHRLPRGVRDLDGLFFRVGEELVHLAGQLAPGLPGEVKGLGVGARVQTLHFLHGVQSTIAVGTEVGAYVVHYADGSTERIPIVYGRDVVNWWQWTRGRQEVPTAARVAWTGSSDVAERNPGLAIRLYASAWTNPHPDREVATIDVVAAGTMCDPFLVAVTAERPR